MSVMSLVAITLIVMLLWKVGAPVARYGGALLVLGSLVSIAYGDSVTMRAPTLLMGVALWLLGHFVTAHKSKRWHSRLAKEIATRTPLRYIDPVDGRGRRQARRAATRNGTQQEPGEAPRKEDDFAVWEREFIGSSRPARTPVSTRRSSSGQRSNKNRQRVIKTAMRVVARVVPGPRALKFAWRLIR